MKRDYFYIRKIKILQKKLMGVLRSKQVKTLRGNDRSSYNSNEKLSPPRRVIEWIHANECPSGGIYVNSKSVDAYPEVTGYLIPTLLNYGERTFAIRLIRWLLCIQRSDGSFTTPIDGISFVFDTGQVLRGLLSGNQFFPDSLGAIDRAAKYLYSQMVNEGRGGFIEQYHGEIPESVNLYVLPPLLKAAELLHSKIYKEAVQNCLTYYISQPNLLNKAMLTHFLAYEIESLIDLGQADLAAPILDHLRTVQQLDGAVQGVCDQTWVCTPGLAQLAVCWYKLGQWEPADKAMSWLESHQNASGGFWGSYGKGASYFRNTELPWAAKFYLDANTLRVNSFFERNAHIFPESVVLEDGRLKVLQQFVKLGDCVLEVGCGKGRFLQALSKVYPENKYAGVDISPALLDCVPTNIQSKLGSLESIPYDDNSFDIVFSVEAIEHSSNLVQAVDEMVRVAKPGGWIVIIDKQQTQWGRLDCPPWEMWPNANTLQRLLNRECDNTTVEAVGYDKIPASDGLMMVWSGQKRSRLSVSRWKEVIVPTSNHQAMVKRIQNNKVTAWGEEIILNTEYDDSVLEIGSGTGEISLLLAQAGRKVTAIDYNADSLAFTQQAAQDLGITIRAVKADAFLPLPFSDNEFDCVWSSGLLEHFNSEERIEMLKEWRRVTKKKIVSFVPNASCIAYRAGKMLQEQEGVWPWGLENPILSLQGDYRKARLETISEYSIGVKHALNFLPTQHPLRQQLEKWFAIIPSDQLKSINQGYLLVTIGIKKNKK